MHAYRLAMTLDQVPVVGPCPSWCPGRHPLEEPLSDESGWVRNHELPISNPDGLPPSLVLAAVYQQEFLTLTDDGIESDYVAPRAWFWAGDFAELDVDQLDLLAELIGRTRAALVAVSETWTAP